MRWYHEGRHQRQKKTKRGICYNLLDQQQHQEQRWKQIRPIKTEPIVTGSNPHGQTDTLTGREQIAQLRAVMLQEWDGHERQLQLYMLQMSVEMLGMYNWTTATQTRTCGSQETLGWTKQWMAKAPEDKSNSLICLPEKEVFPRKIKACIFPTKQVTWQPRKFRAEVNNY